MKKIFQCSEVSLKHTAPISHKGTITSSQDAYEFLNKHYDWDRAHGQELAYVICLNRQYEVIALHLCSIGGLSSTIIDPKIIFKTALLANSAAIMIAHNHPSGSRNPSVEDKKLTNKILECGKFMELPLVDHIIITAGGYFSFADEGLL